MTSAAIARELMQGRWMRNFVLPSYTPLNWWENDVFEVTKSGYWTEYEIKVSAADFERDGLKSKTRRYVTTNKHDRLASGDETGPGRFYFVVPVGLEGKVEIPSWAGLMVAKTRFGRVGDIVKPNGLNLTTAKEAPRIHRAKIAESVLSHARGVCYYRFHEARKHLAVCDFEYADGI